MEIGCIVFEVRHFECVEYVIFLDRFYDTFNTVIWHRKQLKKQKSNNENNRTF